MSSIETIVNNQRAYFKSGATRPISFRMYQLETLKQAIIKNEKVIKTALKKDLNKSDFEAYETEIGFVLSEISHTQKHLAKWAKQREVMPALLAFPSRNYILPEPYGVTLIMSPWNYPFQLTMTPLIGSIAAGNCAVLKPSNYAPTTADVIAQLTAKYFKPEFVTTVQGGRRENQDLLDSHFDFIFFTGGEVVGRIVMKAASKNLTPLVLELGGKSPCIVDRTANLKVAAQRIAWGKFINAGQTCVAPDYLVIQRDVKEEFLQYLMSYITKYYGKSAETNADFPRIVNEKHFERLLGLMNSCGNIIHGGTSSRETLQIAPTLLDNVTAHMPVMKEEIFGPLLPIITFDDLCEVHTIVEQNPSPLALYLFTTSKRNEHEIIHKIPFGGGCVNEVIMHMTTPNMPFGGVGASGLGRYHGKFSFETFSHEKSILDKYNFFEPPIRYAPHSNWKKKVIKLLMR